jgi:hypothetical protein
MPDDAVGGVLLARAVQLESPAKRSKMAAGRLLNREILYTLDEVKVQIEARSQGCRTPQPDGSLGTCLPTTEALAMGSGMA